MLYFDFVLRISAFSEYFWPSRHLLQYLLNENLIFICWKKRGFEETNILGWITSPFVSSFPSPPSGSQKREPKSYKLNGKHLIFVGSLIPYDTEYTRDIWQYSFIWSLLSASSGDFFVQGGVRFPSGFPLYVVNMCASCAAINSSIGSKNVCWV